MLSLLLTRADLGLGEIRQTLLGNARSQGGQTPVQVISHLANGKTLGCVDKCHIRQHLFFLPDCPALRWASQTCSAAGFGGTPAVGFLRHARRRASLVQTM
jgi:hypothetical protein